MLRVKRERTVTEIKNSERRQQSGMEERDRQIDGKETESQGLSGDDELLYQCLTPKKVMQV